MNDLDRYGRDRLLAAGKRIAADREISAPTLEDVVWLLTMEAARTWNAMPGLPRRGYPGQSCWPEILVAAAERFGVARQQATDRIDAATDHPRLRPTSAAVTRAQIMSEAWHKHGLRKKGARKRLLSAVWDFAAEVPVRVIKADHGLHRNQVYRARDAGCEDVATAIFRQSNTALLQTGKI